MMMMILDDENYGENERRKNPYINNDNIDFLLLLFDWIHQEGEREIRSDQMISIPNELGGENRKKANDKVNEKK